jgi:hypothetical protein
MTNPAVSGPAPASDHDGVSSATAIMPRCSAQRKRERVLSGLTSKLAAVKLASRVERSRSAPSGFRVHWHICAVKRPDVPM